MVAILTEGYPDAWNHILHLLIKTRWGNCWPTSDLAAYGIRTQKI